MELEDLREMDKKEQERVEKIRKRHQNDKKVDINVFYKDFKLNKPYTSFNPQSSIDLKPFQLSPFFSNVIIDIKPFQNENIFEKHYGMNVERMFDLKEEGFFKFRLTNNYTAYKNLDNDYLDLILQGKPPSLSNINFTYGLLNNNNHDTLNEIFNLMESNEFNLGNLLNLDLGISDPMVISAMDIMAGHENIFRQDNDTDYKLATYDNFKNIWACGFNEINDYLKIFLDRNNGRLDWAFVLSEVYSNYLSNPVLNSLNGTTMINSKIKYWANDLSVQNLSKVFPELNKPDFKVNYEDNINPEIAKIMSESIGMNTVLDYDEWADQDFNGAIKALKKLEKIIDSRREEKIVDYTIELKNELNSASKIAKDLQEGKKNNINIINWFSTGLSIMGIFNGVITGDLGSLISSLSLASIPLTISSQTGLTDWVLSKINKHNKESHVLYFYDNYDKINFKNFSYVTTINPANEFSKFNDDLKKKYDYYEYLYQNIPSIKVMIDIKVQNILIDGMIIDSDNKLLAYKLNKFIEKISLESKLRYLLQHFFLYGAGYFIEKINKNTGEINDIFVINPQYVRQIKNNGIIKNYVLKNNKLTKMDNIISFNGCSIIEKSMPIFDAFYFDVTETQDRPVLLHDEITNNNEWSKNNNNVDESIKLAEKSLRNCKILNNEGQEVILLFQLGVLYMSKKDFKKAITFFEESLNIIDDCKSSEVLNYRLKIEEAMSYAQKYDEHYSNL